MTSQSNKRFFFVSLAGAGLLCINSMAVSSAHAQVAISEDGVTFPDNPEPVWGLKQYEIGDVGPAGGRVFYVTADGLHGLEAARDDSSSGAEWGCVENLIHAARAVALGTGERNTDAIIYDCGVAGTAARLAAKYVAPPNGYFDWYLPSKDELALMYDNIGPGAAPPNTNVGGFVADRYWSSSEFDGFFAWYQLFDNGYQNITYKSSTYRVRAVRAF